MAQHIVQHDQNIWDIALQLYGSIEGVFALMICNPSLSLTSTLKGGDVLNYYDSITINTSIVDSIKTNDYLPANSERHVYVKTTTEPLRMLVKVAHEQEEVAFSISGDDVMIIDWGDNSDLQSIKLTDKSQNIHHGFDNKVDDRIIKIYGEFTISELNVTGFYGSFYPINPIIIDSFISHYNYGDLTCLQLFSGMVELDLQNSDISSLAPIYDFGINGNRLEAYNGLQLLNLLGVKFNKIDVLDDYLEYIADSKTHGTRRPCTILLDTSPSERGMTAIKKILNEPEWNEAGFASSWIFNINGEIYTTEN